MNAQGRKRMLVLAEFLRTRVPKEHFYMGSFSSCVDRKTGITGCGATACALGWATQIPSFKRAGFVQTNKNNFVPKYKQRSGFEAAELFLGIDDNESDLLFGMNNVTLGRAEC